MSQVKRIGPFSAFKIGGVLYVLFGLVMGVIFALFSMAVPIPAKEAARMGAFRVLFGVGAVVILPLFYGVIGAIFAAITAAIYNLTASIVGGLEVEIKE